MTYQIVTLSKFPDIFQQFAHSVNTFEPEPRKIVVLDAMTCGQYPGLSPLSWTVVKGINPFIFARNANIGIRAAGNDDVVLVNDDVCFMRRNSMQDLARAAYSDPKIGIVSPVVAGSVGNPYQHLTCRGRKDGISISPQRLAMVCVYIKRSTIDLIGLLDERFDGYGGDDDDFSYRAEMAGLKLAITTEVQVRHGFGRCRANSSFSRVTNSGHLSMMQMRQKFIAKHGVPPKH